MSCEEGFETCGVGSRMRQATLPLFFYQFLSTLAELRLGCDKGSVPVVFSNDPLKPSLVCGPSACLSQANVTCERTERPCTGRHQWLRSVTISDHSPAMYTCCRSPQVLRSSLQRAVPVLPNHSAFMRGFEVSTELPPDFLGNQEDAAFQFGEIITVLRFDQAGTAVLEVSRFKCGRALPEPPTLGSFPDYGSYGRIKRNALIEPLDKPACDSEWSTEVVSGIHGGGRESVNGGVNGGGYLSRVTDLSFCGVEVRPTGQAFLTF